MDQAEEDHIRHEIEDRANTLFPGAIRRVEWPRHGDDPHIEPGEVLPILVLEMPAGARRGRPEPRAAVRAFQRAHGTALRQFQEELSQRWPEVRHVGYHLEDASGRARGGMIIALEDKRADGDVVPVMVRLKPAELEIVDTLVAAGIAGNRAEAIRWALSRIAERPAYARIREHTRDIERLKSEF